MKKIIPLLIIGIFCSIIFFQPENKQDSNYLRTVAYVPLDDRPVNYDRVIMAGEAMGIKVLVPESDKNPEPNLFATKLDGQPKNTTNLNLGSSDLIVNWLRDVTVNNNIDGYIISDFV